MRHVHFRAAAGVAGPLLAATVLATTVFAPAVFAPAVFAPAVFATAVFATAVFATAVFATTGPASAAATPGWRVIKTFSQAQSMTSAVATSTSDAWTSWYSVAPTGPAALVERWNGSAWRQVPVPSSLVDYMIDPLSVAASSASNVWVFYGTIADGAPVAVRWNGSAWRLLHLPDWVIRGDDDNDYAQAAAFSPSSVWVFSVGASDGLDSNYLAARYNGRTWVKVPLPATPTG